MSAFKNNHIPESMCKITDVRDKHIMYRKGEFYSITYFICNKEVNVLGNLKNDNIFNWDMNGDYQ